MPVQQNLKTLLTLFVALFTSMLGIGIIVPILPLYAETLGASGIWIGLIFSGFSISRFVFMPIVGSLSDKLGRKIFIATGLFIYALISLGFVVAERPETLTLLRFGQGFGAAMIVPIAQAYVGEIAPANREGKYMGFFSVALFSGFAAGPLMAGIIQDNYSTDACFYVLSSFIFFSFLLVCLFLPELRLDRKNSPLLTKAYLSMLKSKIVRGLIVFRFTTAMCRGAIITFMPIFAHNNLQLSSSQIGIVISGNILFTSILQVPFGILADKVSRKNLVIMGGLFFSGFLFIIPFIRTFIQLLFVSFSYGIFGALVLPAATAIMVEEGRVYGMGSAMSLFNMSMSLGLASGALVAGLLTDTLGINFVFYFFSMIGVFGIIFFAMSNDLKHCESG